mgnify:CR=1 FL=1
METKFNFKSQICTSREQSERLLALGLKKETADCVLPKKDNLPPLVMSYDKASIYTTLEVIPAWSLHRLLSLYNLHYIEFMNDEEIESVYDIVIDAIEQSIKEGSFNKEYLE